VADGPDLRPIELAEGPLFISWPVDIEPSDLREGMTLELRWTDATDRFGEYKSTGLRHALRARLTRSALHIGPSTLVPTPRGALSCGPTVEEAMNVRRHTKFVREGAYGAEVDVELIDEGNGWSPYLSLDDARKLDAVREALRRADLEAASRLARVFSLTPVRR